MDPARAAIRVLGQDPTYGPQPPPRSQGPPAPVRYPAEFIGPLLAGQRREPPTPDPTQGPVPRRPLPVEEGPIDPARAAARALQEGEIVYGPPPPPQTDPATPRVPVAPLPIPDIPADPARQGGEVLRGALPGSERLEAPATEATPVRLADAGYPVHGQIRVGYRYRHVSNEDQDQDLQGSLSLDFGDRARHPITGHFYGSGWWDLDGAQGDNLLNGIQESYDRDYGGFVWDAYADLHVAERLPILRVGRQSLLDTPAILYLDGIRMETAESRDHGLWAGGYVGSPVRYFRSSSDGDVEGGLAAGVRPWRGGRLRLDWMHLEEQTGLADLRDDLFAASAWQNLGTANAYLRWTWLDSEGRDVLIQANGTIPDADLLLSAKYFEQLITLGRLPVEIDPFFESAFFHQPYRQLNLLASKGFGEQFSVDAGFDIRRLADSSDEGQFNREFEHLFVTPTVYGAGGSWSLSLTGDFWRSDGEDVSTVTADFTVDVTERFRAALGTGYSLFKLDTFTGLEEDDVRDFYVRLGYDLTPGSRLDLTYSYEDDDLEDYHTLRVFTTWSF